MPCWPRVTPTAPPCANGPRRWPHSQAGDEPLWSEALTGLHCLQRAVRFYLLRMLSAKKTLLATLSEADAAVERLRQAAVAALVPGRAAAGAAEDFAALADDYPDFVLLATPHGRPTYLNRAARKMLGIDEAAGVPDLSLHHYYAEELAGGRFATRRCRPSRKTAIGKASAACGTSLPAN